jgi:hypothetical protein
MLAQGCEWPSVAVGGRGGERGVAKHQVAHSVAVVNARTTPVRGDTAMKPVDETVPRMTQDGLTLILGGRTYGKDADDANYGRLLQMGVPPEMDALTDI